MADEIVAKYRVDVTEASKNLTDLANASVKASDAMAKSGKVATDSFLAGSNGAKRLEAELARQPKTLAEMELKLRNLKELLRDDTRIGTEGFKQVTKAIKETEAAIEKANGKLEETKNKGVGVIGTFKNVAAAIGIAFGVQQIISFGKEAVQLAAKAEGVERAFARIGSPSLLEGLRAATRGTVTDLVLMQNAVKADNFKIPLEQLGSLFAFAQQRSRATGESVDYLVDSIILGIGRKSIPILDNLGISAVELKEKLGDTAKGAATIGDVAAAVGKIAQESLQKTGVEADTTADKLAQLETKWINLKTTIGSGIIGFVSFVATELRIIEQDSQAVADAMAKIANASSATLLKQIEIQKATVETAREVFSEASSDNLTKQGYREIYDAAKINLRIQKDILEALEEKRKALEKEGRAYKNLEEAAMALGTLDEFTIKNIEEQIRKFRELDEARGSQIKNVFYYTEAIKALNEKINAEGTAVEDIMPLLKQRAEMQVELTRLTTEQATGTVLLNQQLSELKKELDSAEIGGAGFWAVLDKIEKKTKELWEATAMTKLADALIPDSESESESLLNKIKKENDIEQQAYLDKMKNREEFDAWLKEQDEKRLQDVLDSVDKERQAREATQRLTIDLVQSTLSAFADIYSSLNQIAQNSANAELAILQKKYDEGQISAEQFEQEQIRIQRESTQRAKEAATFNAIIGASQAAINALSSPGVPFPVALAFSLLAVATAAAQIAAIQSTPLPQFAEGGWVDAKGRIHGRKHAQGGVHIEAEGDEFIVKGARAKQYPNIIEAVNDGTIMRLIKETYVAPAVNAAMFNGFQDIGRSAELNGLTANLKDHNIIAALDRSRQANTYGFAMLAEQLSKNAKVNRRKQW